MKFTVKSLVASTVLGMTALSTPVWADAEDMRALTETKISLVEAIQTAEKHIGGQAYDASLDDDSFSPAFEIDVAKGGKSFDVRVDGKTGEVLGSREDRDLD